MAYIQSHKNQNYLIPPKITDLFSQDHVCYLIQQIADNMDYSEFDKKYAGAGHPAYHPRINVKLLMMAYIDGIRSSRRIAKNSQENVVYIFLAEKTSPDFRTISDFRKDNKKLVKNVFKQINNFAFEQGMIDLSHLMPDGTSIKANANNDKNLGKKTLEKLDKYIDRVIEEGMNIDEEEDKLYRDRGMHELPEELNDDEKRRPIVRKIVDEINKAIKENKKQKVNQIKKDINGLKDKMEKLGLKKYSFTDPDSRFMLNKKGKIELSYNAQLVSDKNGLIVSNNVVQDCDDRNQLLPDIADVEEKFGKLPEKTKIVADGLYENGKALQELVEKRKFDVYIPGKNIIKIESKKKKFVKAKFFYDKEKDVYICPENKILRNVGKYFNKQRKEYLTIYKCGDCSNCLHKKECCKKAKQRVIHATPYDKVLNKIKDKLLTKEGKEVYKLRKQTIETAIGDLKHNKNFRDFLLRGLEKVKTEFNLVCIAHNLVMINNLLKKRYPLLSAVNC